MGTGDTVPTGSGRPQDGGNYLLGGDLSDTTVCFVDVGCFGSN